jgi:cytochrome c peroxidase
MNRLFPARLLALGLVFLIGSAHSAEAADPFGDSDALLARARRHFEPLPKESPIPATAAQVELGRKLFFDPRFSSDGTVSCMRCHQPALFGTDGLSKSLGVGSKSNARNAPTVLNVGFHAVFHWHGDRESLEAQASKSLAGPNFGNPDAGAVLARIAKIPGYAAEFKKAYPEVESPLSYGNVANAIGAFERSLVSRAPFDSYLEGEEDRLGDEAKRGLKTFMDVGCIKCHDGSALGGGPKFKKFGVHEEYWKYTGSTPVDQGRFETTGKEHDRYRFKVPSLRNVTRTAPYFHDGSVASLGKAVSIMAKIQLETELSAAQVGDILAFLDSLTGEIPAHFRTAPLLPPGAFVP